MFHGLSKTVEGTALAAYLSELTITLAPEPPESADCLRLLLNTLYMTAEQKRPLRQLKASVLPYEAADAAHHDPGGIHAGGAGLRCVRPV